MQPVVKGGGGARRANTLGSLGSFLPCLPPLLEEETLGKSPREFPQSCEGGQTLSEYKRGIHRCSDWKRLQGDLWT